MYKEKKINKPKKSIFGKFTPRKWLIYMIIPTFYLLVLTVFVIRASLYTDEEAVVGYSELGNVDYKVYLKENNFYNSSYLEKDMQYIASLIDYIDVDFEYEMHSTEKMNYTYKYNITADLLINDPNDNNKLLYKKTSTLVDEKEFNDLSSNFVIGDSVKIDYGEFNSYVNDFKKEYSLSVKSRLLLTMEVTIVGESDILKENFSKVDQILVSIPLSEQTVDIGIDTSDISNSGTLERNILSLIKKPVLLGTGFVVGIVSLVLLYISLYTLITSRSKKDIYKSVVNGILREYDRAIVSSNSIESINEENYRVIEVSNFDEILDAHDALGQPILYSEIIKNKLSYFIITSSDILYKYVVDRGVLEKKEKEKLAKKDAEIVSKMKFLTKFFKKSKNK